MLTVLVATRNRHKIIEIQAILGRGFTFATLNDFPAAPAVVEDAHTFAGNATKKAVELANWLASRPHEQRGTISHVLADDSGLEVDAIGGAPGVHSARFAAMAEKQPGHTNSPDADNNARLLSLLSDVPAEKRTARFRCVLALAPVPPAAGENSSPVCLAGEAELGTRLFQGTCEGRLLFETRGRGGFGYDPLFVPDGYELSFAELPAEVKNALSHRFRALQGLKSAFPNA